MIQKTGIVYLVGAGPGDPGLISVKGRTLLELADVVVYDYLANPKLLVYCPRAEQLYVGKKAASHTLSQDQINDLLIERARQGNRVVRLKGGDPFIFGRGGEECEALHRAGIRFEVVPGITAAIGATAYAGIPITHRDFNSSFTLITGHEKEEQYKDSEARLRDTAQGSSDIDWSVIAKLPCIAFYMGVKSLPRICRNLIDNGMSPEAPAATIQWGTTPQQRTVVGTITDLPTRVSEAGITAPAITIVGRGVTLRERLNWFESLPLFGQTIVVTRTRQQASELSLRLEELGANVIEAPTIELSELADSTALDSALANGATYDWIAFTSANGVKFAKVRLRQMGLDVRAFGRAKIAAIGETTAAAVCDELALRVDLCPESFVAEALADALELQQQISGKRFLLLQADIARTVLRDRLVAGGAAEVADVPMYQSNLAGSLPAALLDALKKKSVDWITFTSGSTARNLAQLLGPDFQKTLADIKLVSIGPITTQALTELGLSPTVQADQFNIDGLVRAILATVGSAG